MKEADRLKAKKLLDELLNSKDPEIYQDLARAAHVIAQQMFMQWLDIKRINHCFSCPSTDQLMNLYGRYYCVNHLPEDSQNGKLEIIGGKNGATH